MQNVWAKRKSCHRSLLPELLAHSIENGCFRQDTRGSFGHSNEHWKPTYSLLSFSKAVLLRHCGELGLLIYFWVVSILCCFKSISWRILLEIIKRLKESSTIPGREQGSRHPVIESTDEGGRKF